MGFWDRLIKTFSLGAAVEESKDDRGKPDPYKAEGIAAGMGYSSSDDRLELSDMLHAQGAFDDDEAEDVVDDDEDESDDDESFGLWSGDDDVAWREEYEGNFYLSVDPEDYETEEEYREAVVDAGYELDDY